MFSLKAIRPADTFVDEKSKPFAVSQQNFCHTLWEVFMALQLISTVFSKVGNWREKTKNCS
jgi:hypothetical protein